MKKLLVVLILAGVSIALAQQPPQPPAVPQTPQQIVDLWFRYYNELDGTEATTNRLLGLYAADAMHQTGPSSRQLGPVFYEGQAAIRKMAMDTGTKYAEIAYRVEYTYTNCQREEAALDGARFRGIATIISTTGTPDIIIVGAHALIDGIGVSVIERLERT